MKVIIAGCRDISERAALAMVQNAVDGSGWRDEITEVVHGGASGIDSAAAKYFEGKLKVTEVAAKWTDLTVAKCLIRTRLDGSKYNALAGPNRNEEMAQYADALIAIWDSASKGTRDMIEAAKRRGLKVYVYKFERA